MFGGEEIVEREREIRNLRERVARLETERKRLAERWHMPWSTTRQA